MKQIKQVESHIIPLWLGDIDTDMIIPAQYLTQTSKEGYGERLFARLKATDQNFVFNQARYQDSKILVTGDNFGCGSSREHAVWALQQAGVEVIIAPSFSDIFFNNAAKNGLLLIKLDREIIESLCQQAESRDVKVAVDLESLTVSFNGETYQFDYDPFRRECLLNAQDDLAYLLSQNEMISAYEEKQTTG
ncbi:3-isopropylmalate dehydratase small subunit [Thiotrichales bacterium 19S9-12]|nr:3-isopropylmalate dehydratase small subunit [Thiotrichales bacterium 19S9-11]MCF6812472.1 3-isopropylmalate dehydratase small subunit [Thiotrichales bacterium 19S9-12]